MHQLIFRVLVKHFCERPRGLVVSNFLCVLNMFLSQLSVCGLPMFVESLDLQDGNPNFAKSSCWLAASSSSAKLSSCL